MNHRHGHRWAFLFVLFIFSFTSAFGQRQMEKLGRGLVVLKTSSTQTYLGWRLLATDPDDVTFNLYRSVNGAAATKLNLSPIAATTDYLDTPGSTNLTNFPISYYVKPVIGGVEQAASPFYTLPPASLTKQFLSLPLHEVTGGADAPYDVKFVWVGDFDGDGEYDYLVDRLSTTEDANQYLQAYKRDGTFLWQMDMGVNSVNQYVYEPGSSAISIGDTDNVTVYDMDGDGKAEVLVRTANGVTVTNAAGTQVATITAANNTTQFVSVIDGLGGAELARTTLPNPWSAHGTLTSKCAIAYLDGVRPSVIFYGYNRADSGSFYRVFNAFDFRNGALTVRWTSPIWGGEGHQIRVADVDHDGKDEICDLGFTIDDDGSMLFDNTGLQHGDRFHISDMDPDRPGMETFIIQQYNPSLLATAFYEAGTGKMIRRQYNSGPVDVGRGDAGDFNQNHLGMEMFSTQPGMWGAKGNLISQPTGQPVFPTLGIWWDADPMREFMSGANASLSTPTINKWVVDATYPDGVNVRKFSLYEDSFVSAGGTAAVSAHQAYGGRPGIIADLFGDWREESIQIANDYNELRIYTTKNLATSRLYCLMQNAAYRMQATTKGYYQSNFTDYYLGTGMQPPAPPPLSDAALVWKGDGVSNVWDTSTSNWNQSWFQSGTFNTPSSYANGQTVLFDITGSNNVALDLTGTLTPASVGVNTPKPYTFGGSGVLSGPMKLTKSGGGALTLTGSHNYTGTTLVAEGALVVNGSLTSSPVTVRGGVWLDGAISGTGMIGNGAVIQARGSVSPGNGPNSVGTLTISGSLSETDAYNRLDLSNSPGGSHDRITVQGNLSLSGSNILQINPTSGTLVAGTYTLITYTGTLTGTAANLTVRGLAGVPYSITVGSGSVNLIVHPMRAPGAITWSGSNGNWNLATTTNWLKSGVADVFVTGDGVTFDATGTAAATATLADAMLPASVTVNSTSNYTFAGSGYLSGNMGLTKSGTGMLTINTSNDFTGPVSITGGVLAVSTVSEAGAAGGLGAATTAASNLSINGGTLRFTGLQSVTDRGVTIGAGGATFDTPTTGNLLVWKGLLAGSGPFTKTGAGTLILNGTNTYTGATTISGGTVSLADDTTNRYGLGNGGTGTITINNATFKMYNDDESYNATYWTINVPTGSTGTLLADSRCELHGALTGSGIFNFYTPFSRTDLFGNWSAFTGQINVTTDSDGGDFRIQNTVGYGNASINLAEIAMYYAPAMSGNLTINIGALSGGSTAGLYGGPTAGRTLTWNVGARNLDTTFAGMIDNGTGPSALTKTGTGTLTLSGANTYTGATTVSAGKLVLAGGSLAGSAVTVQSGAGFGGGGSVTGNVNFNAGSTVLANPTAPLAITGNLTVGGAMTVSPAIGASLAPGTYILYSYSGTLTGTPNFTWSGVGYIASFNTSVAGQVSYTLAVDASRPAGDVTWTGTASATWDYAALNWNHAIGVTAFKDEDSAFFDDSSSVLAITLGGTLNPAAVTVNSSKNYSFGSGILGGTGRLTKAGGGTLTVSTAHTYSGGTSVSGGTLAMASGGSVTGSIALSNTGVFRMASSGTNFSSNPITLAGGADATISSANLSNVYGGVLAGPSDANLSLSGPVSFGGSGTAQFGSMLGTVTIPSGSQLRFSSTSGANGNGGLNTAFVVNGILNSRNSSGGGGIVLGSLAGSGTISGQTNTPTGSTTFFVGARGENTLFSGVIANSTNGTVHLAKTGTGSLTLTGASTYTGGTNLSAGALLVTGSLGTTVVSVSSGATIGGTGSLGGNLTLASGSKLALGFGSSVTKGLTVSGTATLNGSITVVPALLGGTLAPGTYTLLSYTGSLAGSPNFTWDDTTGSGYTATFNTATAGQVKITVVGPPVPPGNLTAVAGDAQVALTWSASSGATSYSVQRSNAGGSGYVPVASGLPTPAYTDTSLGNGTVYFYVVTASNSAGTSSYSNEASATPAAPLSALQNWRVTYFGSASATGPAANDADFDYDGTQNLIEYGLGTDPVVPNPTPYQVQVVNSFLQLTFNRIADPTLTYTVKGSGDLAASNELWVSTGSANTAGEVSVSDTVDSSTTAQRFLKLEIRTTSP